MKKTIQASEVTLVSLSAFRSAVKRVMDVSKRDSDSDLEAFQIANVKRKKAKKKG